MGELGFQRNAKKCKEKFENVYKYHKRTKHGRSSKSQSKTYRYSDQLKALESAPPPPPPPPPPPNPQPTVNATSSSTSSDEDVHYRRGQKRKWKTFFKKLMGDVIQKQEHLQKTFLECLEKRERDRIEREEAWRVQERARLSREHELVTKERSLAAAKDAAVIEFLKKVSDEQNLQIPMDIGPIQDPPAPIVSNLNNSSSRWPKAEVEALINLRTNLDVKYGEGSGQKGPLWEEVSASMGELGYNRSSKRCKEKWENINKYFKKVKEGNRKRSEDGKTCPYFHQLDAIYRERESKSGLIKPGDDLQAIIARPEQQWQEQRTEDGEDGNDGDD